MKLYYGHGHAIDGKNISQKFLVKKLRSIASVARSVLLIHFAF